MTGNANIEDIHRLTELQEAMLIHRLQRGDADTGLLGVRGTLVGELDGDRFTEAWRQTLARHPAARSSVHWEELKHPVQVVSREVDVTVEVLDWSDLTSEEQRARREEHERAARARGLDVGAAPVMRWTVARLSEREHLLLWSCHHLLLDGWSSSLLLSEVLGRYAALGRGEAYEAPPAPRFQDWVAWLRTRDETDPAGFWRTQTFRLGEPLAEPGWAEAADPGRPEIADRRPSVRAERLEEWCRPRGLTPATVFLGGWALALAEATGSTEPVFGFTVSGRSAGFDGIESLVGMLTNTVPFATVIDPVVPVDDWFRGVAETQRDVQEYERCSLGALLRAGGLSPRRPLFDTLLAYANYPGADPATAGALELRDFESDVTSGYPLTLAITPGSDPRFRAYFLPTALGRSDVEALLTRFDAILTAVVSGEAATLGDLVNIDPAKRRTEEPEPDPEAAQTPLNFAPREDPSALEPEEPATPVENQLLRIWLALLELPRIGLDRTFFELGGDSVLLPKMIDRVHRDFGVELPLGVIFESPTVRGLAKVIESGNPSRTWRCLVPIREIGSRPPLYLMHGLEGEIGRYYDLANRLPQEQPVYGVQAPAEPQTEIPAMAERYLAEIREHQPEGPYYLGGFCIGGILAYEMSRQLTAAGERVGVLALLDALAPGPLFAMSPTVLPSTQTLGRMLLEDPKDFLARVASRTVRSARRLGRSVTSGPVPVELDDVRDMSNVPAVYYDTSMRHFRAARDFEPEPWDGDASLLRTVDERFSDGLGWEKFIRGRLRIEYVPGNHTGAFEEPHVQETGRKLAAFLAETGVPTD